MKPKANNIIKTISLSDALEKTDYENSVKKVIQQLILDDFPNNKMYLFRKTSKISLPILIIIIAHNLKVSLKGKFYDIPLLIYFPDSFPLSAPEIYLEKKSNHIQINKSIPNYFISQKDLRVNFQLYKKWKKMASSIHEILDYLIDIFNRFFPLFSCKEGNNFSGYCELDYNNSILIVENNNSENDENNSIKKNEKNNENNNLNNNENDKNNKIENNKNENNNLIYGENALNLLLENDFEVKDFKKCLIEIIERLDDDDLKLENNFIERIKKNILSIKNRNQYMNIEVNPLKTHAIDFLRNKMAYFLDKFESAGDTLDSLLDIIRNRRKELFINNFFNNFLVFGIKHSEHNIFYYTTEGRENIIKEAIENLEDIINSDDINPIKDKTIIKEIYILQNYLKKNRKKFKRN
jgi:ubiquitin-protein ligase